MKKVPLLMIFSVLAIVAQQSASQPSAQDLLKLEETRIDALIHNDFPRLEKLLADDLTYTHSSGLLESKADFLGRLRSGKQKYEAMKHEDGVAVRTYGDTAVLTGSSQIKIRGRGEVFDLHVRFTEVWVKRRGQWQVVAWQTTRIPAN